MWSTDEKKVTYEKLVQPSFIVTELREGWQTSTHLNSER